MGLCCEALHGYYVPSKLKIFIAKKSQILPFKKNRMTDMSDDSEDEMKKITDERVNAGEEGVRNEEKGKEEKSDQQKSTEEGGERWNETMRKKDIDEKDQNISEKNNPEKGKRENKQEDCSLVDNNEKTRIDQEEVREKTFTLASNSGSSSSDTSKRPKESYNVEFGAILKEVRNFQSYFTISGLATSLILGLAPSLWDSISDFLFA